MSSNAPIPDVAQCLINWELYGRPYQNQLFFNSWQGPITQARLDLLRNRVAGLTKDNFLHALGQGVRLRSVELKDRTTGSSITSNAVINFDSFSHDPAAATSIALALINVVSTPAEVHPSRSFISGVRLSAINGNFIDPSYAEGLRSLWATNNASHGPFGWHHVAVSLYSGGVPRTQGTFSQVNDYVIAHLVVSAQQRREIGAP